MLMKNIEIYHNAMQLANAFVGDDVHLPMKINFYMQKNKKVLMDLSKEIEDARLQIAAKYGVLNEEGTSYNIPEENIEEASKELSDLFSLEQEVNIYTIKMEQLPEHIELSTAQMEAMLFMIDDSIEE